MNDILKDLIKQFMPFAQKQIGFERPPRLFLRHDAGNAKNPLGKTAFYDPSAESVTLYVSGRHPKDILRSLGHELVHHKQNCDGEFSDSDDMGPGYAQRDPHLRDMEEKANRDGSMCLRDFEDKLKKENTIYYEHLLKGDNKMSIKDWKNEEIQPMLVGSPGKTPQGMKPKILAWKRQKKLPKKMKLLKKRKKSKKPMRRKRP